MSRYAFDIDGVIANSYPKMVQYVEKHLKCAFFYMPYHIYKYCQITKEEFLSLFFDLVKQHAFKPMEGAVAVISRYYLQVKKPIILLSHRDKALTPYTEEWINKHFNIPFELHSCHELSKVEKAMELGIHGIIEDQPWICKEFIQKNMDHICIHQPWHDHAPLPEGLNIVHNWAEIAERILDI